MECSNTIIERFSCGPGKLPRGRVGRRALRKKQAGRLQRVGAFREEGDRIKEGNKLTAVRGEQEAGLFQRR